MIEQTEERNSGLLHGVLGRTGELFAALSLIGMSVYNATHLLELARSGVENDLTIWAGAGVLAVSLTGLAVPLIVLFREPTGEYRQRLEILAVVDFALMGMGALVDYNISAGVLSGWVLQVYRGIAVPLQPVIIGFLWMRVFFANPAYLERQKRQTLR